MDEGETIQLRSPWRNTSSSATAQWSSLAFALTISVLYPISVHIWPGSKALARDDPIRVRRNFVCVMGVMLLSSLAIGVFHRSVLGPEGINENVSLYECITWKRYPSLGLWLWHCVLVPLLLVMLLFLGPLCMEIAQAEGWACLFGHWSDVKTWRNLVVAPISEEFIFRGIVLSALLPCWSVGKAVLISSFTFGLMHTHYFIIKVCEGLATRNDALGITFQCFYTTLFAWYSAHSYLISGHIVTPILVHTFCNIVGFPNFGALFANKRYTILTIVGFVTWLAGFAFLTYSQD